MPTARVSPSVAESRADFEQPDVILGRGAGCAQPRRRGRDERRPQRVELGRQRVRNRDRRGRAGRRERLSRLRFDETERHRFGEPRRRQHPPDEPVARNARIGRRRRRGHRGEGRRQLVESVVAADFLDEIDFAQQIDAKRGRGHVPTVGGADDGQPEPRRMRSTLSSGTATPRSAVSRARRR